ncbi:ZPR1 zinc-finger domain-containing protein [Elsinoe ampelina]|uniref:ZPR1 zinc-finger domain-containing protein n=1 Tax=Elsinoe ampelina TaxID=302913 RepID=A0A6A6G912_9PEZI|nr:ZPR1 zinc-finger domain-containing protein [Elsinoe ampelina]
MAANGDGEKLSGPSLAKDLFEDMRRQVDTLDIKDGAEETEQKVVEEIESLCMNCHEDGVTRLLLTKIPFFKEIVIMSFACESCGFKNSEIQSAGEIQERGAKYTFKVETESDLQRQVVKGDNCTFKIEDIDLEIPAGKGRYTNIEGLISSVRDDLASHQEARMEQMPEVGQQVATVIRKLSDMLEGKSFPFTVTADDFSGNSWIEPAPRDSSGKYAKSQYNRTASQNGMLGLGDDVPNPSTHTHTHENTTSAPETTIRPEYHSSNLVGASAPQAQSANNVDSEDIVENQVYTFPASCPGCTRPCDTHMKMVNIPYFKQVVLMSTVCDHCGYRSNEVKTGGEVPEKGQRITLKVSTAEDLARDILKSESAALNCPELGLQVEPGTLGGRFTTVEGLLTQFRRDLRAQAFDLDDGDAADDGTVGDSMATETKRSWDDFFATLTEAIEGKKEFTVIIEDPLAGSYVQSLTAPEKDPKIEVEEYERTEDEEEHLGLRDIKVEGYEDDADGDKASEEKTNGLNGVNGVNGTHEEK